MATSSTEELGARQISADEAAGLVRPGDHVFVGSACGTPRALVEALELRDPPPQGVVLVHSLTDRVGIGDPPRTAYRHRVFYVGADVREQFENDLKLEMNGVRTYNAAIELCSKLKDNGTRELLEGILKGEESSIDWLETQLHLVKELGKERYLAEQIT